MQGMVFCFRLMLCAFIPLCLSYLFFFLSGSVKITKEYCQITQFYSSYSAFFLFSVSFSHNFIRICTLTLFMIFHLTKTYVPVFWTSFPLSLLFFSCFIYNIKNLFVYLFIEENKKQPLTRFFPVRGGHHTSYSIFPHLPLEEQLPQPQLQ